MNKTFLSIAMGFILLLMNGCASTKQDKNEVVTKNDGGILTLKNTYCFIVSKNKIEASDLFYNACPKDNNGILHQGVSVSLAGERTPFSFEDHLTYVKEKVASNSQEQTKIIETAKTGLTFTFLPELRDQSRKIKLSVTYRYIFLKDPFALENVDKITGEVYAGGHIFDTKPGAYNILKLNQSCADALPCDKYYLILKNELLKAVH